MTGSIHNQIYAAATKGQPEPVVGMGATILMHSDRHACTIVEVFKIGKDTAIRIQRDHAKRTDDLGMSDSQDYAYTPNPKGAVSTFRFRGGQWEQAYFNSETKRWRSDKYSRAAIGFRREYYDFSF